jgi:hypothetical protein
MKLFLDPEKPLNTCKEKSCDNCNVNQELNCHFKLNQLITFLLSVFPVIIIGGIGIYFYMHIFLIPWLVLFLSYFGFIEIRVLCSHCPHYAETEIKTLKCWANYGSPKLWKYRPGPMSFSEKIVFILGALVLWIYPVFFVILSKNYTVLVIYLIFSIGFVYLLRKSMCTKCINFACPSKKVDILTREKFFKHNPEIGDAWKK